MFLLIHQEKTLRNGRQPLPLHSTMFLLIPRAYRIKDTKIVTLHSTMFLLIRFKAHFAFSFFDPLHSTMFLLILKTFSENPHLSTTLHSTMFLLIRENRWQNCILTNFTFHDVSINTLQLLSLMFSQFSLHSTMFLLIQDSQALHCTSYCIFTFHDVSINT